MNVQELEARIDALVADPAGVRGKKGRAIDEVIAALDEGKLRVASPDGENWITHAWIKRAILLYFARMENAHVGDVGVGVKDAARYRSLAPSYFDKVPTKRNYKKLGVRCVPPGVARYGSFLGRGAILMPGYVNIGAYVDEGTMVDTWATVGSCAQIGKNVHLSGGVGIGGVLEPPQAAPVIVEDGAFIGSRCIIVEGVRIGKEAVLGAGVVITGSTSIVDVRGSEPKITKGYVEPRSVVIPGTMPKTFPAGEFGTSVALVIGTRTDSTDMKTSLNAALRDFEVSV
jgi:2,3,4,5-tetrahydropyridine-2-carboxylate N-succinyltransferase